MSLLNQMPQVQAPILPRPDYAAMRAEEIKYYTEICAMGGIVIGFAVGPEMTGQAADWIATHVESSNVISIMEWVRDAADRAIEISKTSSDNPNPMNIIMRVPFASVPVGAIGWFIGQCVGRLISLK